MLQLWRVLVQVCARLLLVGGGRVLPQRVRVRPGRQQRWSATEHALAYKHSRDLPYGVQL